METILSILRQDWQSLLVKGIGTALFVIVLTEVAKRNAYVSAVVIAFPLMTVLTVANLYFDTGDAARASKFAYTTFWLIVASLAFFIVLYVARILGLGFWAAFSIAVVGTVASIIAFTLVLRELGIDITKNTPDAVAKEIDHDRTD